MPRMYHDDPKMTGGPTTADVPEDAVPWMQRCGWYLKQEPAQAPQAEDEEPAPVHRGRPRAADK